MVSLDKMSWKVPEQTKERLALSLIETMTKRELFAIMAMQGILAAGPGWPNCKHSKELSNRALIHADALLDVLRITE